jgi:riboflavin kinase/FMN adenylyltransferase
MTVTRIPDLVPLDAMPAAWRGGVVAIGNFDGVHRGHQAVLMAAKAEAARRGVACLMLTLEPHPRAFFSGRPVFRLAPPPVKAALADAIGLDGAIVLEFDRARADQSAADFVSELLIGRLGIAAAVTGRDFHFGKARKGTPEFLAEQGRVLGFDVLFVDPLIDGDGPVSSTRIRNALAEADIAGAARLLGWHYSAGGTIVAGSRRGRSLGYPTANMHLDSANRLAEGIYAVRLVRADGSLHDGVASHGRRPTFGGGEPVLETFLFGFSGDLYGEEVLVSLFGHIRTEQYFESVDALVERMDLDSIDARAMLERAPPTDFELRLFAAWARGAAARRAAQKA